MAASGESSISLRRKNQNDGHGTLVVFTNTVRSIVIWVVIQVAIGGALGAVSRFLVNFAFEHTMGSEFPYATMAVNVGGSFLLGIVFVLLGGISGETSRFAPLIMVGFLGGFTTFSTYSLDSWTLFQSGRITEAALYIFGSVFLSLAAIVAGIVLTRSLHN